MKSNLILLTDSYKVTQYNQYPPDTTGVYSYFESRGGMFDETTFFGLQYLLAEYLQKGIQHLDLWEAEDICGLHFGKTLWNAEGWKHILRDHSGNLPLKIKAVPEGMTVPVSNVLMTVENTCPKCYWLTNYLETLLVQTWYPMTVATYSRQIKKLIKAWLEKTGCGLEELDFKLHDFGFRGVSSVESAGWGGCAHLVNFKGTDTMEALRFARDYYSENMAGFSIPASEHSTMTSWGRDHEAKAYANMLTLFPTDLVAVVSDSYDIYNACRSIWGETLKEQVKNRKGRLVIRPDSGYPPEVVSEVLRILGEQFGYTVNRKGFKMLPPYLRVIQGDGVDYGMIGLVYDQMYLHGWAADNVSFGMGGALLQKLHRDTQRVAFKCAARRDGNGRWLPVQKKPATDPTKNSKAGRMKLVYDHDHFFTLPEDAFGDDVLQTVFLNGEVQSRTNLHTVRTLASL